MKSVLKNVYHSAFQRAHSAVRAFVIIPIREKVEQKLLSPIRNRIGEHSFFQESPHYHPADVNNIFHWIYAEAKQRFLDHIEIANKQSEKFKRMQKFKWKGKLGASNRI